MSQTLEHIQVGSALRLPKCELIQPDFAAEPIEGAVPFQRFKRGRKRFERMTLARPDELRHMSGVPSYIRAHVEHDIPGLQKCV